MFPTTDSPQTCRPFDSSLSSVVWFTFPTSPSSSSASLSFSANLTHSLSQRFLHELHDLSSSLSAALWAVTKEDPIVLNGDGSNNANQNRCEFAHSSHIRRRASTTAPSSKSAWRSSPVVSLSSRSVVQNICCRRPARARQEPASRARPGLRRAAPTRSREVHFANHPVPQRDPELKMFLANDTFASDVGITVCLLVCRYS